MTRSEKQAHWQQQIEQWQRSGLSQQAWCTQHDIKLGTFTYWRSKAKTDITASTRRFMPLSAPAVPLPNHGSSIGVALADGIRIDIPVVMVEQLLPVILRLARSTD